MRMPLAIRRMFWDTVIVIEERATFYDCLYMGGGVMSAYGDLKRTRMRDSIDRSMQIRRIRRMWYHFTEDTAAKIAGFVCLLMALGVCVGVWYALNGAMGLFR